MPVRNSICAHAQRGYGCVRSRRQSPGRGRVMVGIKFDAKIVAVQLCAATSVEPEPQNGSSTTEPTCEKASISGSNAVTGF